MGINSLTSFSPKPLPGVKPVQTPLTESFLSSILGKRTSPQCSSPSAKKSTPRTLLEATRAPNRSVDQIKALIASGEDVNQTDDVVNQSPLHTAAFYNDFAIVKLLVSNKANVNQSISKRCTPLMIAVEKGHTSIAKYLIQSGTDLSITNKQGFNSLHKAAVTGNSEILSSILEGADDKFDINAKTRLGLTLHQAA